MLARDHAFINEALAMPDDTIRRNLFSRHEFHCIANLEQFCRDDSLCVVMLIRVNRGFLWGELNEARESLARLAFRRAFQVPTQRHKGNEHG